MLHLQLCLQLPQGATSTDAPPADAWLVAADTPTVGWACLNYHKLYRRPRGMYFSAADRGEMVCLLLIVSPPARVRVCGARIGSSSCGLANLGSRLSHLHCSSS